MAETSGPRLRRRPKARAIRAILAILIVLIGAVIFMLATAPGGRMVALIVNRFGSSAIRQVEVDRVTGLLSGSTRIGHVLVTDGDGEPWLLLSDVAIDWSPRAVFSAGLSIHRLAIGRVELAGLPKGGGDAGADPDGPFALPLNVDIKSIDLPDILVGEAIAGRVARFRAGGALRLDSDLSDARADLSVERIDGVGGKLSLDATLNLPEERFDLDAALAEPAGGVLAHLAGLSETEALAITAKSSGKLSDWALRISGEIDGARVAGADIDVKAAGGGAYGFDAIAEGAIARFLPPSVSGLFAGDTHMIASGTVEPGLAGVEVDVLTLDSASLSAEGRGRIARAGAVDFTTTVTANGDAARLSFGDGDGRIDVAIARIEATLKGNAEEATVALAADLPLIGGADFSLEGVAARADFANANLAAGTAKGTLAVEVEAAGSANAIAARALAGKVSLRSALSVAGTTIETDDTVLSTGTARLQLTGNYDTGAKTAEAVIAGEVNPAVLSPGLPATLGHALSLSANAALAADGGLAVSGLVIESERLRATGEMTLDADRTIAATLAAAFADLAALDPRAAGKLNLAAEVAGPVGAPDVAATLIGDGITVDGKAVEDLKVTARGVIDPANPAADVEISGAYFGKPITGSARLAHRGGVNEINPLRLSVQDNRIEGALVLDADFLPTGTIRLDLPDLAALSALMLQDLAGSGSGNLVFKVADRVPSLEADVTLATLSGSGFSLSAARVRATVANYVAAPAITGDVAVSRVDAGGTDISGISLRFAQAGGWTEIDGRATADAIPVTVAGRVRQSDGATEVELSSARLSYRGLPVSLSGPARVVVRSGVATIEKLALSPGGGTVSISGTAGERLALDVRLAAVPLTVVEAFAPGTGLKGAVSGTVGVTGTASAPSVRYDLNASGVGAAALAAVSAPPLAVAVTGTYGRETVEFSATAGDGSGLKLNAAGRVGLAGSRALSIRADGSAPFSLVAARLAAQGLVLNGTANVNVSVGGSVGAPDLSGSITTKDARFVDTNSGIAITDIAADIGLDRQSVRLRSLTGNLSGGGTLSGSGTIGLDAAAGYPGDLSLKVARGRYADGKLVATHFDADLSLKGPLTNYPVLGGVLTLDQTTITVPSTLPSSVAKLDVTHQNAGGAVKEQAARLNERAGSGAGGGLGLDLRVDAPNRIFVRGRGIDAEFSGSLTLRGTTGAPVASGAFNLVRGRLDVLGKRINLDRGNVGFSGSMIPTLDFAASTTAGDTTATILVTGLATAPQFSFTSVPSLPEDEVLAHLIFGRSLSNLSPLQIAQLASAAAELTGVTSGGGIVDKLRKATGIDDLDVRTDEKTGDTSVGVGKYLNDRTYIGIEQGQSAGSGKARIDLDLGRGLKLRGEATSGGETKGGLFFERDY